MKKLISILLIVIFISYSVYAIDREENDISNLVSFEKWVQQNIKYKSDGWLKDYWQSPNETILLQTGDCEDFALLYSAFLTKLNVDNNIIILITKKDAHAICLWRDINSKFLFSSNEKIYYTGVITVQEVIQIIDSKIISAQKVINKEFWYVKRPKPQPRKYVQDVPLGG